MTLFDLALAQATDPFRVVLLIALVFTTYRTSADTGFWLPLALGTAFVAALIPLTFGTSAMGLAADIGTGLAVNALLLAVILAARAAAERLAGRGSGR
jgi:hypothetical protein